MAGESRSRAGLPELYACLQLPTTETSSMRGKATTSIVDPFRFDLDPDPRIPFVNRPKIVKFQFFSLKKIFFYKKYNTYSKLRFFVLFICLLFMGIIQNNDFFKNKIWYSCNFSRALCELFLALFADPFHETKRIRKTQKFFFISTNSQQLVPFSQVHDDSSTIRFCRPKRVISFKPTSKVFCRVIGLLRLSRNPW